VSETATSLKRSPLFDRHVKLGAKLVPFGGWEMPLSYPEGTLAEHLACRRDAVAFDVSHLGTVRLLGPDAFSRLQATLTNDLRKISPGRAQYTHLLDPADASVLDDIIVWWVDPETFDVMPNASNTSRVLEALGGDDVTATRAVIALQGPQARRRLAEICPEAAVVGRFRVARFRYRGAEALAAGTGYTGEDGVECALPAEVAGRFWDEVLEAGFAPAGLGARDTLRLEAALPLHGQDIGPGITPLQAGLGWVVSWDKPERFAGREALLAERTAGPSRQLVGLVGSGRQPLRRGATVLQDGVAIGEVTSGNFSPVLSRGIALALVGTGRLEVGDQVELELRGRVLPASVVKLPFVDKKKG